MTPGSTGDGVLLIAPPLRYYPMNPRSLMPPLGLLSVAAAARERGHAVAVIDAAAEGFGRRRAWDRETETCGLGADAVARRARRAGPRVVGISCLYSITYPVVRELARRLKRELPGAAIVLGGPHPTYLAAEILAAEPAVDFVVLGEGEATFAELVDALHGRRPLAGIRGLARRDGAGAAIDRRDRSVDDLDALPPPAWDLVDLDLYAATCVVAEFFTRGGGRHASIETTRGCPHRCAFCVSSDFWGRRQRRRSAAGVLAEMERLITGHGVRRFGFVDDDLLVDRERFAAILRGIVDRGWGIEWYCPNGFALWRLDGELLDLMRRSGMTMLCLSPETASPELLAGYVGKPVDAAATRAAAALVEARGLRYFLQFIVGFPAETRETLRATLRFAAGLDGALALFNMASPLPGTRLLDECRAAGALEDGFDFTRLNYTRSFVRGRDFGGAELTEIVQRRQVLHNLRVLARRPGRAIDGYGCLLRKRIVVREMLRIHAGRLLGLGAARRLAALARRLR
jgi:magnesium-protoporphyrin IX monomethyl ester (oxidative) cyclase